MRIPPIASSWSIADRVYPQTEAVGLLENNGAQRLTPGINAFDSCEASNDKTRNFRDEAPNGR